MMNNVVIAIIDDGVSRKIVENLCFNHVYENRMMCNDNKEISYSSHGSICASIIRKYAPQAEIGSIRILNDEGRGTSDNLVAAIRWCTINNIKIIHLSNGTTQACDIPELYEAVNEAERSGCIIVAACKNECNVSFPASFMNVIGVHADKSLVDNAFLINNHPNGGVEFSASGVHNIILSSNSPSYITPNCSSYAAPVVTANIINLLLSSSLNLDFSCIRNKLYQLIERDTLYKVHHVDTLRNFIKVGYSRQVPLVIICDDKLHLLTQLIIEKLLNDNYLPITFTDCKDYSDYRFFYIEGSLIFQDACYAMAEFYSADIIIAAIQSNDISDITADLTVYQYVPKNSIAHKSSSKSLYVNGLSNEEIYKQVIAFLEENE